MRKLIAVFVLTATAALAQDKSPDSKSDEKVSERKPLTIYFEQAQQRANHAHEQLMAAQRRLKQAVRAERSAADELSSAQRKYEDAKKRAEAAAQASQAAQAEEVAAQERWSKEAESLQEAHRQMETGRAGK
jgi:hypothetical protein